MISHLDHQDILDAVLIHRDAMAETELAYWPMAATFLYQERWETILEQRDETEAEAQRMRDEMDEADRERRARLKFNDDYYAWLRSLQLGPNDEKPDAKAYKAWLEEKAQRQQSMHLRVVGES